MKQQQSCAQWQKLLATPWTDDELSSMESAALKEHLAGCAECAAVRERYVMMISSLRAHSAVTPLPNTLPQLIRLKESIVPGKPATVVKSTQDLPRRKQGKYELKGAPSKSFSLKGFWGFALIVTTFMMLIVCIIEVIVADDPRGSVTSALQQVNPNQIIILMQPSTVLFAIVFLLISLGFFYVSTKVFGGRIVATPPVSRSTKSKGGIVVWLDYHTSYTTLYLRCGRSNGPKAHRATNVMIYEENCRIATFLSLEPGDYIVFAQNPMRQQLIHVAPTSAVKVDWRNNSKQDLTGEDKKTLPSKVLVLKKGAINAQATASRRFEACSL
jgi:hypothetical protein